MARVDWIDKLKGFLIFLVVLGHVVGGGYHIASEATQPILSFVFKLIYLFHMPAFFFVSGFTFVDSEGLQWYVKKIKRLLVPYFCFGIASGVLYLMMYKTATVTFSETVTTTRYDDFINSSSSMWQLMVSLIHGGGWPNGTGFRCNSVLWFLPCMFSSIVLFKWLFRMGMNALLIVSLLCVVSVIFDIVPKGLPWGLSKMPWFFPYMVLGWFAAKLDCMHCVKRNKSVIFSGFVLITGYFVITYFIPDPDILRKTVSGDLLLYLLGGMGCVLSVFIVQMLKGNFWIICGSASLGIMLLHKFLVLGAELKISAVRWMFSTSSLTAVSVSIGLSFAITVICIFMTLLIRRVSPWLLGER